MDPARSSELTRHDALALLGSVRLGRIAVSVDALPVVLPVFLTLIDERIVLRSLPGTDLSNSVAETIVALAADRLDESTGHGWSVLVRGMARRTTDPITTHAARAQLGPFGVAGAPDLVEVSTDLVTGRRLG